MKKISFFYIVLASVLWGTSGIFVHFLAPYGFSALQMTFLRALVSLVAMSIYLLVRDRSLFRASPKNLLLFFCSGVSFFGTASCYYYSMQATSISTAVVLMYTAPIFVMIYSVCFLGEKLTKLKILSVVGMIIGCGLVSGVIGGLRFDLWGIIIGFMSGISYSAYNIFAKINMKNNCNPLAVNLYGFLAAVVVGLFLSNPGTIPVHMKESLWVTVPLVIGMGICTCILPYLFYTLALKDIPAGTASSLGILEPMAATIFSVLFFQEKLTLASISGIILILGAVYLLSKHGET